MTTDKPKYCYLCDVCATRICPDRKPSPGGFTVQIRDCPVCKQPGHVAHIYDWGIDEDGARYTPTRYEWD